MSNKIPRNTEVIKATFKENPQGVHILWLYRPFNANWFGSDENGNGWWQLSSSDLRNSDICSIKCFSTFDEARKAGFNK